jgi:hypothetical protein
MSGMDDKVKRLIRAERNLIEAKTKAYDMHIAASKLIQDAERDLIAARKQCQD